MKETYRWIVAIAAALILSHAGAAESFTGKVVGVSDGDTISVMRDGKAVKVRLHGVDCPESSQDYGSRARQFSSEMVFGKVVAVEVKDIDRYGRVVGEVTNQEGSNLNQELVRNGLAWWYRQYAPNDSVLSQLESQAKASGVGLWSMPEPVAPWDFRKGKSKSSSGALTSTKTPQSSISNPSTGPPNETGNETSEVYVTKTGAKYHRAGCRYLSKSMIPISLEQARAAYGPCSVCGPPR